MANLYMLTGPAGVGKSTISREIARRLPKSVLLEGDDFYHHVVGGYVRAWEEGNHLGVFWKVALNTIKLYLEEGYDVVFNYIINNKDFEKVKETFKDVNMKFTVLLVDEEEILKRDKLRPTDCQMKERCIILLNNFKNYGYDEKYILDTTNLTVEETILEIINNDKYKVQ